MEDIAINDRLSILYIGVILSFLSAIYNGFCTLKIIKGRTTQTSVNLNIVVLLAIGSLSGVMYTALFINGASSFGEKYTVVKTLDSFAFLFESMFLFGVLILNAFRFRTVLVLKKFGRDLIEHGQEKLILSVVLPSVVVFASAFGVIRWLSHVENYDVILKATRGLQAFFVEIPFVIIVILEIVMLLNLLCALHDGCGNRSPNLVFDRDDPIRKVKKMILLVACHITLYIIPSMYVRCVEFVVTHLSDSSFMSNNTMYESYWMIKLLLILLNPASLGQLGCFKLETRRLSPANVFMSVKRMRNRVRATVAPLKISPAKTHHFDSTLSISDNSGSEITLSKLQQTFNLFSVSSSIAKILKSPDELLLQSPRTPFSSRSVCFSQRSMIQSDKQSIYSTETELYSVVSEQDVKHKVVRKMS